MHRIEQQISTYVARHYTVPKPTIHPSHRLRQDLGLSEWEFLDVLVYIEQLFKVDLPDDQLNGQLTVNQLSGLVYQYSHSQNISKIT